MQDFTPIYPRSISGGEFRIPLDHPDVEAVASRADWAYRELPLTEIERGRLIARYADLVAASTYLWGAIGEQRIEDNGLRPHTPKRTRVDADKPAGGHDMDRNIGFVFRCRDYLQRLEDKHGWTAYRAHGIIEHDDPEQPSDMPVLADDDI